MKPAHLLAAAAMSLTPFGAGAADAPGPAPKFEVSGVVIRDDGVAWALLSEPSLTQGRAHMVAPGGTIGPYTVVAVARDHVVLRGPSEVSFKVRFSWRSGGGGAPTTAGVRAIDDRPAARTSAVAPAAAAARAEPEGAPDPAPLEAEDRRQATEPEGPRPVQAVAPATPPSGPRGLLRQPGLMPPQPEPPLPARPGSGARVEQARRARDQMFRRELSVEGYFHDKKK